ncbi:hypothetical protein [Deinococcus sp.]|uniref:hypothetical protein n=1 Tax=Deinococcus sp. TaxID=47478 RepID=UPI003B59C17E
MKAYTRSELLDVLTAKFLQEGEYQSTSCGENVSKDAVKSCFLTSKAPIDTNAILGEFEKQGLEPLTDWQDNGRMTFKRYGYDGDGRYLVSIAFTQTNESLETNLTNSDHVSQMALYVDQGN